jgi:hypothetical protein
MTGVNGGGMYIYKEKERRKKTPKNLFHKFAVYPDRTGDFQIPDVIGRTLMVNEVLKILQSDTLPTELKPRYDL